MSSVFVNGKFAAQRTTGVQRVAAQLVLALDRIVGPGWVLLTPPGARPLPLQRIETRSVGRPGLPLHAWEQAVLPRAARDGLLLNMAGSAPACARRQACLLHDAAVFDVPEAYTRAFVAWYRWLFRRLARTAERLLTVSRFSQLRLAACLGVDAARIAVVPNGCDHLDAVVADMSVLDRHALRGRRYLLAVGSLNTSKNLPALLQAQAGSPDAGDERLVVVGGGNARVFAGAAPPAAVPGVIRTGALDDPPLKALYENACGLVFPSLYEGFGLPPLEAMACGCPVAVSNAASLPEVCGDAALYVDPQSGADIAAAMARLRGDVALRERLRRAGHVQAARFRWHESAATLLDALALR